MRTQDLIIHCYAEQKADNLWQAFCLNYDLAAQGESFEEVKSKISEMILDYLDDALDGDDKAFADQLLQRSAPWWMWAKYRGIRFLCKLNRIKDDFCSRIPFDEVVPMSPSRHRHA